MGKHHDCDRNVNKGMYHVCSICGQSNTWDDPKYCEDLNLAFECVDFWMNTDTDYRDVNLERQAKQYIFTFFQYDKIDKETGHVIFGEGRSEILAIAICNAFTTVMEKIK